VTIQTLILRYAVFAVVATIANLATQRVVLHYGDTGPYFAAAVGAGTIVGLVIKYVLDKNCIFYDLVRGIKSHSRKFLLYTAMGLSVDYLVKYNLDRRFVFTDRQLAVST